MAVIAISARYGHGTYGLAEYGVVNLTASLAGVAGATNTPSVTTNVVERPQGVAGVGATNTVTVNIREYLTGVSAGGSVGILEHSNTKELTGVAGTGEIAPVVAGGFEIDITERIGTGVEATGQVGSPTQIKVGAGATGVSVTGSIGSLEHSNTTLLQSVVGTLSEPSVEPQPTEKVTGVFATGAVNDNFTHSNTTLVNSVSANGVAGQTTETGVLFDFFGVREQYDRRRTIKIPRAA